MRLRTSHSAILFSLLSTVACGSKGSFDTVHVGSLTSKLVTVEPTVSLSGTTISRVLLLSVDGLHTTDLYQWIAQNPRSNLASVRQHGVSYLNALAMAPSNGFPAMLALATGGTPKTTGVYYDDSYDRTLFAPGSNCQGTPGTEVVYTGAIDQDMTQLFTTVNTANLPLDPNAGQCSPVLPHQFLKVNTIFELVQKTGGRTAWADSHPAYEILSGPSGTGVSDLYTPEVSSQIANGGTVNGVALANSLASCDATTNSTSSPTDYTTCEPSAMAYDDVKVQALINEIDGFNSPGTQTEPVPALFGMNFEEVGVAQTLQVGGDVFTSATALAGGAPPTLLQTALQHVDTSVGRILSELDKNLLVDSTLVVLTAKHGQAPIDRTQLRTLIGPSGVVTTPLFLIQQTVPSVDNVRASTANPNIGMAPAVGGHLQADDVGLLWLQSADQTSANVSSIISALSDPTNASTIGASQLPRGSIFSTNVPSSTELTSVFGDPSSSSDALAAARAPNAFIQPNLGVIYTANASEYATHGGGTLDDIRVPLVISNPAIGGPLAVGEPVHTTQVAVTILNALAIDPTQLQAAKAEGTQPLPALTF
ncbi:MAG: alkaline phosphatase family protein [Polyangiaceae bacterium]|nr:alkaline phosphatase family protein [Polyangiaceae bacterium]